MTSKIVVKPCPYHGRRPNLTPQETAFPYNAETPVHLEKKAVNRAKASRVLATIGSIFAWVPLVLALVYIVFMTLNGEPQHIIVYVFLFASLRLLPMIGGILLYIAAKIMKRMKRLVGWIASGMLVFPIVSSALMVIGLYNDFAVSPYLYVIGYYLFLATVLFMICLNVLSIFLLKGLFSKNLSATTFDAQKQPES